MAILKLCSCGKKIPAQLKKCDECIEKDKDKKKDRHKQYDKTVRNSEENIKYTQFYNSKEWQIVRKLAGQRSNFLCEMCLKDKLIKASDVCDHIIPIKVDWSKRTDLNNLQMLCHYHHSIKTVEDKKKYK